VFVLRAGQKIAEKDPCPPSLCNGQKHLIVDCPKFLAMPPAQRWEVIVIKEKRCRKCFRKPSEHKDGKCKGRPCQLCGGNHHRLLHGARPEDHVTAKKFRINVKQNIADDDEDPDMVLGMYLAEVYEDILEDAGYESAGDDRGADEVAGADEPVGDGPTDGSASMGPTTAHMHMTRTRNVYSARVSLADDVRRDLEQVNEAQYSAFTSPLARQ
jgi:hypothetical protein